MKLYIQIQYQNVNATERKKEYFELNVFDLQNLRSEVEAYLIFRHTWKTIFSFRVVCRLDGSCGTIPAEYYREQPLHIEARQERYNFDSGKGVLIWSKPARVF